MAVPWSVVNWLRGELVSTQGGRGGRRRGSQRVGAIQSGGRGAVTGGGALLGLVLQDKMQAAQVQLVCKHLNNMPMLLYLHVMR